MEQFLSTCFFFILKKASQKGIHIDAQALENSYNKFVMMLFSENVVGCQTELRNILVFTRVELERFKVVSNKKVAVYADKAIQLIEEQINWISTQLLAKQGVCCHCPIKNKVSSQTTLKWTAKKTDLIELLYAFDAAGCFNNGQVSLNQIAGYLEKVFSTNLSHFPRDFYEMRIRNRQMPFMDCMRKRLKMRMDNPKLPYQRTVDTV